MKGRSAAWILVAAGSFGLASSALSESYLSTKLELEAAVSRYLSTPGTIATLRDCVLTVSISYPPRCIPGVDIGHISEDTTLDLTEFDPSVSFSSFPRQRGARTFYLDPTREVGDSLGEMQDEIMDLVLSTQSLPPEQRRLRLSEEADRLLHQGGIRSKVVVRACIGVSQTMVPSFSELNFQVADEYAADLQHDLEGYIRSYCGVGISADRQAREALDAITVLVNNGFDEDAEGATAE
jgi:hypothetical protein